jgi:hypothetical protein
LLREVAFRRGEDAEKKVCEALKLLQERKEIRGFRKCSRGSKEDRQGIDINVYLSEGGSLPLQVKASHTGAHKHCQKYPDIPVAVAPPEMSIREVCGQLREIFRFYNKK